MTSARASATRCCCPPDISWSARAVSGQAHHLQRLVHARLDVRLAHAAHFQAEGDVLRHRHMREQRVVLEHQADVALVRRLERNIVAAHPDMTGRHGQQARDHAQGRGLASRTGPAGPATCRAAGQMQRPRPGGRHSAWSRLQAEDRLVRRRPCRPPRVVRASMSAICMFARPVRKKRKEVRDRCPRTDHSAAGGMIWRRQGRSMLSRMSPMLIQSTGMSLAVPDPSSECGRESPRRPRPVYWSAHRTWSWRNSPAPRG